MESGKKIFVSYKYKDTEVEELENYLIVGQTTARSYVDYLIDKFENDDIHTYKGEANEDLSEFKDETIESELKDKIYDSSITLVLISPKMKESNKLEEEQWIPWEVSYSLREQTRNNRTSQPNAIIGVVLPNRNGEYSYFNEYCNNNSDCKASIIKDNIWFKILKENRYNYNRKDDNTDVRRCDYRNCSSNIFPEKCSYVQIVNWCDFIDKLGYHLDKALEIQNNIDRYKITKQIT